MVIRAPPSSGLAAPVPRTAHRRAGLRSRLLRVFLSALGIAMGIAAMMGVVGISTSSTEELNRKLNVLGTNLLTVAPGQSSGGGAHLPDDAVDMIANIGPVESVSAIFLTDAKVYRNDHIPVAETGGIGVYAARADLPKTVGAEVADGHWLNAANARYPAVVLGPKAAEQLGATRAGHDAQVWLGDHWFSVIGLLVPNELVPRTRLRCAGGLAGRRAGTGLRRPRHHDLRQVLRNQRSPTSSSCWAPAGSR